MLNFPIWHSQETIMSLASFECLNKSPDCYLQCIAKYSQAGDIGYTEETKAHQFQLISVLKFRRVNQMHAADRLTFDWHYRKLESTSSSLKWRGEEESEMGKYLSLEGRGHHFTIGWLRLNSMGELFCRLGVWENLEPRQKESNKFMGKSCKTNCCCRQASVATSGEARNPRTVLWWLDFLMLFDWVMLNFPIFQRHSQETITSLP